MPASVSVINAEVLQNQGAKSLQDFGAYVPGLQIDNRLPYTPDFTFNVGFD